MNVKKSKQMVEKLADIPKELDDLDTPSRLRFEYEILLEEYRVANGQILHRLETDEKSYDSTIITLGAIVASSSIVINFRNYYLLLILAMPFYILIWEQVRRTLLGRHLAKYITEELAPRIGKVIETTALDTKIFGKPLQFVSWEKYSSPLFSKNRIGLVMLLPKAGKAGLQLGVAMLLVGIYMYLSVYDTQYVATALETMLLLINVTAALITVFSVSSLLILK